MCDRFTVTDQTYTVEDLSSVKLWFSIMTFQGREELASSNDVLIFMQWNIITVKVTSNSISIC